MSLDGTSDATRQRVRDLVHRHGFNATAFQTLESGYHYFFGGGACIAYFDTGAAWVAAGAPIGPAQQLPELAREFLLAARKARRRCCFVAAEEQLKDRWCGELKTLRIGAQPTWDPQRWPESLKQSRTLREQLRRARAKRVTVRRVDAADLESGAIRERLVQLIEHWLTTRDLAPMDFLLRVEPFHFAADRACFVAERDDRLLAFAGAVPVPGRNGWFVEDLVREPHAPNGTGELLIDAVMRWAAESDSSWVTLGVAPLAGEVPKKLGWARRGIGFLYDFRGLQRYKAKFQPHGWTSSYLVYSPTQSALRSLLDALRAFTGDGFVRFSLRSWLRGSRAVLRFFAALLVPWTALLALAPAWQWFGEPWVKWGWVLFDVMLILGLFHLLRRPSVTLASVLATAVTVDAVLTLTQAVLWNWPTAESAFAHAITVVACVAPATASVALWGARKRLLRV